MTTADIRKTINDVTHRIKKHPKKAIATYTVRGHGISGSLCEARVRDFKFYIDGPQDFAGTNKAPNPIELLLSSLGASQETLYSLYAAQMNLPVYSVEVTAEGKVDLRGMLDIDSMAPVNFLEITVRTIIESPASEEELKPLIEKVENHCPVLNVLTKATAVKKHVECLTPEMLAD